MPGETNGAAPFLSRLEETDGAMRDAKLRRDKLKKATQDFESIFIKQMLSQMRKAGGESGLFGKSQQAQFYQDMMDETVASHLSKAGGIGLAKILYQRVEATLPPAPESVLRETLQRLEALGKSHE
jgi:Rod binding domain-containing protein